MDRICPAKAPSRSRRPRVFDTPSSSTQSRFKLDLREPFVSGLTTVYGDLNYANGRDPSEGDLEVGELTFDDRLVWTLLLALTDGDNLEGDSYFGEYNSPADPAFDNSRRLAASYAANIKAWRNPGDTTTVARAQPMPKLNNIFNAANSLAGIPHQFEHHRERACARARRSPVRRRWRCRGRLSRPGASALPAGGVPRPHLHRHGHSPGRGERPTLRRQQSAGDSRRDDASHHRGGRAARQSLRCAHQPLAISTERVRADLPAGFRDAPRRSGRGFRRLRHGRRRHARPGAAAFATRSPQHRGLLRHSPHDRGRHRRHRRRRQLAARRRADRPVA